MFCGSKTEIVRINYFDKLKRLVRVRKDGKRERESLKDLLLAYKSPFEQEEKVNCIFDFLALAFINFSAYQNVSVIHPRGDPAPFP